VYSSTSIDRPKCDKHRSIVDCIAVIFGTRKVESMGYHVAFALFA